MDFLKNLDAETIKAELLAFLDLEENAEIMEEFVDFIQEDFSYGDCEE